MTRKTIDNVTPDVAFPEAPPTETPRASKKKAPARVIDDVAPDIAVQAQEPVRWYWVGLVPTCPKSVIECAGICFQKITEGIHRVGSDRKMERIPHAGCVIRLSDAQLELLATKLRSKILRPIEPPPLEQGEGEVLDERHGTRGAIVLSIPTPAEIAAMSKSGSPRGRPYKARPGDRPLAEFLYLEPCAADDHRQRPIDRATPQPITVTKIRFSDLEPVSPTAAVPLATEDAAAKATRLRRSVPKPPRESTLEDLLN